MIDLNETDLLRQFREAKDVEIERLLDQYGTSLKETREMYPQLTEAVSQRQLTTAFPTQPLFFTPSEAQEMGLSLQEGWMFKMTPAEGGYTSSFITPSKWEITEDDFYVSPTGERYSKADMEALLAIPTGEYTVPEIPVATTIEDLTDEGKAQYQEYQSSGGQLDVVGWLNLREEQQLQTEQVFGKVFPDQDISEVLTYIQEQPEAFLADLREMGWTSDTEAFLRNIMPEVTNEDMRAIFGVAAPFKAENWFKDNVIDPLYLGAVNFFHGLGMQFNALLPSVMESLAPELAKIITSPIQAPIGGWAYIATGEKESLGIVTETTGKLISQLTEGIQEKAQANFLRLKADSDAFIQEHPELLPDPKYQENPFQHLELFRDPGYYAYAFTSSLAYSLSVMGTMVAVSAVATPVGGILAGMAVAGGPEAAQMTEELVNQGIPFEEAAQWGELYGLVAGGVEMASDLPFLGLVFKPVQKAVKPMWDTIFKGVASRIARGVIAGVLIPQGEALEEIITQVTHNAILQHYDSTQSLLEGVSQAYIQATIASLPFGAIGGMASYRTFRSSLSTETGQQLDTLVDKLQTQGLTEEQAQVQAVNELARTPEIEPDLSKAIEAAQQEYLESQGVSSVEGLIPDQGIAGDILNEMRIAEEIGRGTTISDVTPKGFGVEEGGEVVSPKVQKRAGETLDEAIAREVGYQIDNGRVKLVEDRDGWKATVVGVGDEKPHIIRAYSKQQVLNEVWKYLNPDYVEAEAVTPTAKELWQMTKQEYISQAKALSKKTGLGKNLIPEGKSLSEVYAGMGRFHKRVIESALSEGKPVPAEVLKDYPDLAAKVPTAEAGMPEAGLQPSGIEEFLATDPIATYTVHVGKRKVHLDYFLKNGDWPESFTLKEAAALMQKPIEAVQSKIKKGGIATNRVESAYVLDEISEQFHVTEEEFIRRLKGIYKLRQQLAKGEPEIPETPPGMPEQGLQAGIPGMAAAEPVRPQPTGRLVQARIDDYLRLREYNAKAVAERIADIKKQLETLAKTPAAQVTKGDLRLELVRLETQQELDAADTLQELDSVIKDIETELANREIQPGVRNLFKEYTTRQLEEMRNVYLQARESMQPQVPVLEPTPKPEPTPEVINRVKTDPTPASDANILKKFIECIKDAKPATGETQALRHKELQKRAAIYASILAGGEGYHAFEKAKAALKGPLPKADWDLDLAKFGITEAEIVRMFDRIRLDEKLQPFQKHNTYEALTNMLSGATLTEGEIALLEKVFGSRLAVALIGKFPTGKRVVRILQDITNVPRTLVTIADLSATFRQGAVLAFGQPVQFSEAFVAQLKAVFSEKNFRIIDEVLHNNPYVLSEKLRRLYVAPIAEAVTVEAREEAFRGRLIERVPLLGSIIRASERAYITFLNVLRVSVATYYCRQWEGTGKTANDYDKLCDFINHATGRGDLGSFSQAGSWLSAIFFSPRFIMSRVQVPLDLINTTPAVRKVIARNLVSFVGVGMLALFLARLAGAETEDDPRSADFGKIKIGNTRIDFWGGYLPYVRVITQIITEERKSTKTGEIYKIDPIDVGVNFFRSKLAPVPGFLWDLKSGQTFIGEELNAENAEKIIFEKLTPMFIQDLIEAVKDIGIAGIGYGILSGLGVGIQTYGDNWDSTELKLGLPVRGENFPYTIENEIYDVKDYYSEISQMIGGATYEMLSGKNVPDKVLSVAKAKDILRELTLLPNKRLTNINADSTKGDTYEQYRVQWLAREKITNAEELKQFDKDYPDAYLGNITQAQYALLVEYHSLPDTEKADFLGRHPELYINPREEWLRTHPEENALLALWGKADIYSPEAQSKVSTLTKQLDIPENALVMKDLDPVTELKLKNQHLFDLIDAYGGLDDSLKGPDGLTARDRAIQQLYLDNPDFRDDQRRIEAIDVGTKDNPTLESMVEGWVERGQIADEFGSSSAEMKLWLIDNKEVHQWALENGLLSDDGSGWNENILRLEVNYREDFDKYANYGDITSPLYISNDTARADAREAMLFSQDKMTSFGVAYYTIHALEKNIPENLVTTYVDYYGIRKKEGVDYSRTGWYDDDWYLIDHPDFYKAMIGLGEWQKWDFTKVPTVAVFSLYQTYYTLPEGQPRVDFRIQHPEFDAWLVYVKDYAYQSDAARDIYSNHPEKYLAATGKEVLLMGFPSPSEIVAGLKKVGSMVKEAWQQAFAPVSEPTVSGRYTTPREMPTISKETLLGEDLGEPSEASISRFIDAYGFTHQEATLALATLNKVDFTYNGQRIETEQQLFDLIDKMDESPSDIVADLQKTAWGTNVPPPIETIPDARDLLQPIRDFLAKSSVNEQQYIREIHDCKQFTSDLLWEASKAGLPIGAAVIVFNDVDSQHRIAWVRVGGEIFYIDPQTDGIFTRDELNTQWQRLGGIQSINRVSPDGGFEIEVISGITKEMNARQVASRIVKYAAGVAQNVLINLLEMYVIHITRKAMDWRTWVKMALGIIL
jgi:hypothetical protein